jgi:hypothetical protein
MLGCIIYDCRRNWINSHVAISKFKFNKHDTYIKFIQIILIYLIYLFFLQIKFHLDYVIQSPNRDFKLFLLFANEAISDMFYFKYLEHLAITSNGKLKITYVLTRPPSNWEELSGHINEDILNKWFSKNHISPTSTSEEPQPGSEEPQPGSEDSAFDIKRNTQVLIQNSTHVRLVTCGPPLMIDSVEESLNNIGFPSDKAIFIR